MLILCCGPDTYRAMQRARELEAAFRAKHDPSGSSIERLEPGRATADAVIERSLAVSLFSPMRFIRADGLVERCPKAKAKPLALALTKDSERVIVVSIEQEKPSATALKPFASVPKLIVTEYPLRSGKAFAQWVVQAGATLGVTDATMLARLADACDGDAWLASNELMKLAAGGDSDAVRVQETSAYEIADAFLLNEPDRYRALASHGPSDRVSYPLFQQAVAALRVHSGDVQGLPPFVVSKLRRSDERRAASVAGATTLTILLARSGLAEADELDTLLP